MNSANEQRVRLFIALFGLAALVLAGLHAGPASAHEGDAAHWSDVVSHGHAHGSHDDGSESDPNDPAADFDADQGHHHCPSTAAPHVPQAEFEGDFGKQMLFALEVTLLRLVAAAPPLDPPKA